MEFLLELLVAWTGLVGSPMQLDRLFDGISFGIAFGMSKAGCFMLVLHSG